jgi:hypothetical protein
MKKTTKKETHNPWVVGEKYLIRTVTMIVTGRLVSFGEQELVLEEAAWIADTGRFNHAVKTGSFNEVEPFGDNPVIVGRGSIIDATVVNWDLPRYVK